MSNTKIVIDKEQILDIIKSQSINHANMLFQIKKIISEATEIQIDQSIEDSAIEFQHSIQNGASQSDIIQMLQDFATSQQIIEQLRVKEKVSELNKCFEKGNQECDGAHCQGCWKDIVRSVIKSLTKFKNR